MHKWAIDEYLESLSIEEEEKIRAEF